MVFGVLVILPNGALLCNFSAVITRQKNKGFLFSKNVYNRYYNAMQIRKEINKMFIVLAGGLLIVLFAVIVAVVSSVVSAVAADQDIEE